MESPGIERGIKKPLSFGKIVSSTKKFYGKEHYIFEQNEAPLRIDRHSGAECVTRV